MSDKELLANKLLDYFDCEKPKVVAKMVEQSIKRLESGESVDYIYEDVKTEWFKKKCIEAGISVLTVK